MGLGRFALEVAAKRGDEALVDQLLGSGTKRSRALYMAASNGHGQLVARLLKAVECCGKRRFDRHNSLALLPVKVGISV